MANTSTNLSSDGEVDEWRFDDNVQRKIAGTVLLIACLVGFTGNGMVIIAVSLTKKLQNVTNVFVTNLAIGDVLHCLILPFMVHDLFQPLSTLSPNPVVCTINGALTILFLSVSVFSHALIAVTRYVVITCPRHTYQNLFTTSRVIIIISIIWVVSAIDPVLSMAGVAPVGYNPKYGICSRDIRYMSSVILSTVRSVYTNLFSVAIVLFCYMKIFIFIRKHNKSTMKRILTSSTASGSVASRKTVDEHVAETEDNAPTVLYTKENVDDICIITVDNITRDEHEYTDIDQHQCNDGLPASNDTGHNMRFKSVTPSGDAIAGIDTTCQDSSGKAIAPVGDSAIKYSGVLETDSCPPTNPGKYLSSKGTDYASEKDKAKDKMYNVGNPNSNNTEQSVNSQNKDEHFQNTTQHSAFKEAESSASHPSSGKKKDAEPDPNRRSRRSWRWRSHKSRERAAKTKKEIDITKKLFVVVCVFFACISPYAFFVSIKSLERLLPYAALLLASSSCLNPIIYGLSHPNFQNTFVLMISCQLSKIPKKTVWLTRLIKDKSEPSDKGVI